MTWAAISSETTVDGHRAYLAYMDLGKQTLDIYRTFVPDSLRVAVSLPR